MLEKDKPPILGLIQRGGEVVLRMLANVALLQGQSKADLATSVVANDLARAW